MSIHSITTVVFHISFLYEQTVLDLGVKLAARICRGRRVNGVCAPCSFSYSLNKLRVVALVLALCKRNGSMSIEALLEQPSLSFLSDCPMLILHPSTIQPRALQYPLTCGIP